MEPESGGGAAEKKGGVDGDGVTLGTKGNSPRLDTVILGEL